MAGVYAPGIRERNPEQRSKTSIALVAVALSILQFVLSCYGSPIPSFPGAEGFGARSIGGRGGRLIEVTNLDDIDPATGKAVPGSLRAAIEATGRRIVVFRVSGTINVCEMNKDLSILSPYITIAGQTAPGDGITLRLDPSCTSSTLHVWQHDVIIRHIRFRPGSNPAADTGGSDAISIASTSAYNIIIDHCSFSWATDENVDISWGARNVTVQHSIVSEALLDAPRAEGGPSGGYGMLIAEGDPDGNHTRDISIHHNIFAHNWYRNPQVSIDGVIDFRNNVLYDWGLHGMRVQDIEGPTRANIVGNYAKAGPSTSPTAATREMWVHHSLSKLPFSYFVEQNIGPRRPTTESPELDILYCRSHYDELPNSGVDCDPATFANATAFASRVTTTDAVTAWYEVLANAGATLPRRDVVDRRIVTEVVQGTGANIASPAQVGGWPSMGSTSPATDTDHDGMPDYWETLHAMNGGDASDGNLDRDGDGYTNVEEYLNSTDPMVPDTSLTAGTPAPG